MSNERANEFLPWRGRLTPPDALPEQGLEEKELTWQRLAERLQKKPRRRYAAWWIAAACFVLAFLPASHLLRTRPARSPGVALHPAARQPVAPLRNPPRERLTVVVPPIVVKTTPPAGRRSVPKSKSGGFATFKNIARGPVPSPGDIAQIIPAVTLPAGTLLADTLPAVTLPAGTLLAVIAPPPPQADVHRQLRVVYLNELNKEPGLTVPANRPPALRLGTAANTADWTTGPQNTSIIKIDLSTHHH